MKRFTAIHGVVPAAILLMFNSNKGVMLPRGEKMRNRDLRQWRNGQEMDQQSESPKL